VTVVVPAFLPNEHEILEHTIAHILSPNDLRCTPSLLPSFPQPLLERYMRPLQMAR